MDRSLIVRFKNWLFQNLANLITIFGLILSFWLLIIFIENPEQLWLILFLVLLIGLTDLFDGWTARRLKIKSRFGGALDRLRDKVFVCPTLFILACYCWPKNNHFSVPFALTTALAILLILLEILLLFGWFVGLFKKLSIEANKYGKIKMFFEFVVLTIWIGLLIAVKYLNLSIFNTLIWFVDLILIVTIYLAFKSLEGYYAKYFEVNQKSQKLS